MTNKGNGDVGAIIKDRKLIDAALATGVREALRRHVQAGQPVVEWQNGKIVWLEPDEIEKRLEKMSRNDRQR